jgi:hypothetical protein
MSRFFVQDNSSGSGSSSSSGGSMSSSGSGSGGDISSRRGTGGGPFHNIPSVVLRSMNSMLQRRAQQRVSAFSTVDLVSARENTLSRSEAECRQAADSYRLGHHDFAQSASFPVRRFELDNISDERHEMPQESGEQVFDPEQTDVLPSSGMQRLQSVTDNARGRRRRRRRRRSSSSSSNSSSSLDEERQIVPDSTTRDVSVSPADNRVRMQITYEVSQTRSVLPTYTIVPIAQRYLQNQDAVVILSLFMKH